MAKAHVTYGCGHIEQASFYRRREADWAVEHPKPLCSKCYGEEWERRRAATREASAEVNAQNATKAFEHGLRMLSGTERQVAYTIRQNQLAVVDQAIERVRTVALRGKQTEQDRRDLIDALQEARAGLADEPSASWWIDRRNCRVGELMIGCHRVAEVQDRIRMAVA